jgi:hypothetical protein
VFISVHLWYVSVNIFLETRMKVSILILSLIFLYLPYKGALAQDIRSLELPEENAAAPLGPADTVKEFYRLLREKRYVEGFRLSVYRTAIDGLTEEELKELAAEFDNTFSRIPDTLKILGAQTNGVNATVFIKANPDPKDVTAEEVSLIQVNGQWRIGDQETLKMVDELGRKFFFEIRIRVNEDSAQQYMERYIGAEKLFFDANKGLYGTNEELIKAQFWPAGLKSGEIYGYKFTIELSQDKRSFWIHAEPTTYSKTGRVSFYADLNGVYKFDNGGRVYKVQLNSVPAK